jgi:hypothetical protein
MLHTSWTFVCKFLGAKQRSNLQVLDQDRTDGNVGCCGLDSPRRRSSEEARGDESTVSCLHASCASHGVTQVGTHLQVASLGTGAVKAHIADTTMF